MNLVKKFLNPFRKIFTKIFIDPSVLDGYLKRKIWHETNAFRAVLLILLKIKLKGIILNLVSGREIVLLKLTTK